MSRLAGPKKARFERVFQEGLRAAGPMIRVAALSGSGLVGLAVSRKIGCQPRRNHTKRRMREALRGLGELRQDADYVFVLSPKTDRAPLGLLQEEAKRLLISVNERCFDASPSP